MKVAVVTSTRGRKTITKANDSITGQTYPATHYVFAHGQDCWDDVTENMKGRDAQIVYLPRANGGGGYGMAPVFAMAGYCVTEDVVMFLDDDNWYEPDHVESLVSMIKEHDLGWAYSLRKIVDHNGDLICDDNCESLGCQPNATGHYLVDNSCYAVRTDVLRRHGHAWYVPIVSDRSFQAELMKARIKCGTTGKHSVNYRLSLDGTGGMSKETFIGNNNFMSQRFTDYPWTKRQVFTF